MVVTVTKELTAIKVLTKDTMDKPTKDTKGIKSHTTTIIKKMSQPTAQQNMEAVLMASKWILKLTQMDSKNKVVIKDIRTKAINNNNNHIILKDTTNNPEEAVEKEEASEVVQEATTNLLINLSQ